MLRRWTTAAAVMVLVIGLVGMTARADTQLLTNGGFETGDMTGWTIDQGAPEARHTSTAEGPAHEGNWFAWGGGGHAVSEASQTFDLAALGCDPNVLDAGGYRFDASAYLSTWHGDTDESHAGLQFLDASGSVLHTWEAGGNPDTWTSCSLSENSTSGTRQVRYYFRADRHAGSNNNGNIDAASLTSHQYRIVTWGDTTRSYVGDAPWNVGADLTLGQTASGGITVVDGGWLKNSYGCLGHDSGSTGTATVTGTGSTWTNSNHLYIGFGGEGTLTIESGGQVGNHYAFLGYQAGSTGTATVTGAGSTWTSSGGLIVGHEGTGTLTITSGGEVSNVAGYLGNLAGSTGTATVTGAGSTWANSGSLYVGSRGSGTLTVADGVVVTAQTLYASLSALHGNGTINTKGAVLDADLVFDSTHGTTQALAFGSGGTLNLALDGTGGLGAGHQGTGTLRIAEGVTASSSMGYLGNHAGSTGTATVTGAGSTWNNNGGLWVGSAGSGELTIESGGQVSTRGAYLGCDSGSTGTVTVTGADSNWTNTFELYIGYQGEGTLTVADGGHVSTRDAYLGRDSGSTGTVTVTGADSNWTNTSELYIGYQGEGTLTVTDGGQVSNTIGYIGSEFGSTGTVTVTGADSNWNCIQALEIGGAAGANGAITVQSSAPGGWGLDVGGYISVGLDGTGTLDVLDGGRVRTNRVHIADHEHATGTAQVTGTGSLLEMPGDLNVARWANTTGTLTLSGGGEVQCGNGFVGRSAGTDGTVTVDNATWNVDNSLYVGGSNSAAGGAGEVTVENDGQLTVGATLKLWGGGTLALTGGSVTCGSFDNTSGGTFTHTGGTMTVDGGTFDPAPGPFYLQGAGGPTLALANGASWDPSYAIIGDSSGEGHLVVGTGAHVTVAEHLQTGFNGAGTTTLDGAGASLTTGWDLNVGALASGTFTTANGATVHSGGRTQIGITLHARGEVIVTNSSWQADGGLRMGKSGEGLLTVGAGASMQAVTAEIGINGTGMLTVRDGGALSTSGASVACNGASIGEATVTGAGSLWENTGALYLGGDASAAGGTGTLTVQNDGQVTVGMTLSLWDGGALDLQSGQVTIGSTTSSVDGMLKLGSDGTLALTGGSVTCHSFDNTSGGTFNWTGGTLGFHSNLTINSAAPFGAVGGDAISTGRALEVADAVTVGAGGALNLTGGSVTCASFDNTSGGTFNWTAGTLEVTGPGGVSIGPAGSLGGSIALTNGTTLRTPLTTVETGGTLALMDGVLDCPDVAMAGGQLFSSSPLQRAAGEQVSGHGTVFGHVELDGGALAGDATGLLLYGDLSGTGTATNTTVYGNVGPGFSPGSMTLDGVTLAASAVLNMEVAGVGAGNCDCVTFLGDTTLGGTLNVELIGGFQPADGDVFDLCDWNGSLTGQFDGVNLPALQGGLLWDTSGLYTLGAIGVTQQSGRPVPEPCGLALLGLAALGFRRRR